MSNDKKQNTPPPAKIEIPANKLPGTIGIKGSVPKMEKPPVPPMPKKDK